MILLIFLKKPLHYCPDIIVSSLLLEISKKKIYHFNLSSHYLKVLVSHGRILHLAGQLLRWDFRSCDGYSLIGILSTIFFFFYFNISSQIMKLKIVELDLLNKYSLCRFITLSSLILFYFWFQTFFGIAFYIFGWIHIFRGIVFH